MQTFSVSQKKLTLANQTQQKCMQNNIKSMNQVGFIIKLFAVEKNGNTFCTPKIG